MSGLAAVSAVAGRDVGFVAGIAWLPEHALMALVAGSEPAGPAHALLSVARALELDFAFVPGHEPWADEAVELLHESGVAAFRVVSGVLGRLAETIGWEQTLRSSASQPGALAAPLAEALHAALGDARAALGSGAAVVVVADDLAATTGPLVAPDFALDALLPCYASIASEIVSSGGVPVFHSDGVVRALIPALVRAGFSAMHVGQLTETEFDATLAAARDARLTLVGGVDASRLLEGARRAGERIGAEAAAGGLVVCDDGGFTLPEEVAAYATALEAARRSFELARGVGT